MQTTNHHASVQQAMSFAVALAVALCSASCTTTRQGHRQTPSPSTSTTRTKPAIVDNLPEGHPKGYVRFYVDKSTHTIPIGSPIYHLQDSGRQHACTLTQSLLSCSYAARPGTHIFEVNRGPRVKVTEAATVYSRFGKKAVQQHVIHVKVTQGMETPVKLTIVPFLDPESFGTRFALDVAVEPPVAVREEGLPGASM